MKCGTNMLDMLKLKVCNGFAAHVFNGHAKHDTKYERASHNALLKLRLFRIVGVDMERMMIHRQHAKQGIVIFGNGTSRPMLIERTKLKLFKAASKLHDVYLSLGLAFAC